jgi:excisionase family DNA binding protein
MTRKVSDARRTNQKSCPGAAPVSHRHLNADVVARAPVPGRSGRVGNRDFGASKSRKSVFSKSRSRISDADKRGRPVNQLRTMDEVAEILGLSKRSVQRLISRGALPVHDFGRSVRVSDSDIAVLLAKTRRFWD